jgi:hypothetical protein
MIKFKKMNTVEINNYYNINYINNIIKPYITVIYILTDKKVNILKTILQFQNQKFKNFEFLLIVNGDVNKNTTLDDRFKYIDFTDVFTSIYDLIYILINKNNVNGKFITWIEGKNNYYDNYLYNLLGQHDDWVFDYINNDIYYSCTPYYKNKNNYIKIINYTDKITLKNEFNNLILYKSFLWNIDFLKKNFTTAKSSFNLFNDLTLQINDKNMKYTDIITMEEIIQNGINDIFTISIIMSYYERKDQLLFTLHTIEEQYKKIKSKIKLEVIIVDDGSNIIHNLKQIIYKYSFFIILIEIEKKNKTWKNPVVPYNLAITKCSGDIIVIQNPEVCHIGNVLEYIINNKYLIENTYLVFSVFSSPSFGHNKLLNKYKMDTFDLNKINDKFINNIDYSSFAFDYEFYKNKYNDILNMTYDDAYSHWLNIGLQQNRKCNNSGIFYRECPVMWKGWYSHPVYNKRCLHFLSVLSKKTLNTIGGFCNEFKDGLWYDDNDFLDRIKKSVNVKIINPKHCYGIHLFHSNGSDDQHLKNTFDELVNKNKKIHNDNNLNNIIFCNPTNSNVIFDIYENTNIKLNNLKIGLFVKTYINSLSINQNRLNIIIECLDSIYKNVNSKFHIYIFVDGPVCLKHKNIIYNAKYRNRFKIIQLEKNIGIGAITNYAINYLLKDGIDIGFSLDDDIIINKLCIENYVFNILKTGIPHFSYFPFNEIYTNVSKNISHTIKNEHIINNNAIVHYTNAVSGCFFSFTKESIKQNGYCPVLKYKYGHEHEVFTLNNIQNIICNNGESITGSIDIVNSHNYLQLNKKSFLNKSINANNEELSYNKNESKKYINKYIPYNDNFLKISIIIAHFNRTYLLKHTLQSISKTNYLNFEIVIVDDNSCIDEKQILRNLINQFWFDIKIIEITHTEKGASVNPSIVFNKGVKNCSGDIIIIQNPESYHIGDIISHVSKNIKYNNYLVYSAFNLHSDKANEFFFSINNKNYKTICNDNIPHNPNLLKWYQHPKYKNSKYHFCSAIYKKEFELIGGFDEQYTKGVCFDDDDLIFKIEKIAMYNTIEFEPDEVFIVNLYHTPSISTNCINTENPTKQKWLINQNIYNTKKNSIISNFSYPRILHLFWHGVLPFLNYLSIISFIKYHPAWIVNVYITNCSSDKQMWNSGEQPQLSPIKNFINYIYNISNVNVIDCTDIIKSIGLNNLNYIYQSDILRIHLMNTIGGVWSDFDIIFIKNIESILCQYTNDILFKVYEIGDNSHICYYPIGFFVSPSPLKKNKNNNDIFSDIMECQLKLLNDIENNKNTTYQMFGASIFNKFLESENIDKYNISFLNNEFYLPVVWNELDYLFNFNKLNHINNKITENTFGIHWFNGSSDARTYLCKLDNKINLIICNSSNKLNINNFNIECFMDNLILEYLHHFI